jgi:hypothetical protein
MTRLTGLALIFNVNAEIKKMSPNYAKPDPASAYQSGWCPEKRRDAYSRKRMDLTPSHPPLAIYIHILFVGCFLAYPIRLQFSALF